MDTMQEIVLVIVNITVEVEVDLVEKAEVGVKAEVEVEEEVHHQDIIIEEKEATTQEKRKVKDIKTTHQVGQVHHHHHQPKTEERESIEREVNQVEVHLLIQVKEAKSEMRMERKLIIKRKVYQKTVRIINKLK